MNIYCLTTTQLVDWEEDDGYVICSILTLEEEIEGVESDSEYKWEGRLIGTTVPEIKEPETFLISNRGS